MGICRRGFGPGRSDSRSAGSTRSTRLRPRSPTPLRCQRWRTTVRRAWRAAGTVERRTGIQNSTLTIARCRATKSPRWFIRLVGPMNQAGVDGISQCSPATTRSNSAASVRHSAFMLSSSSSHRGRSVANRAREHSDTATQRRLRCIRHVKRTESEGLIPLGHEGCPDRQEPCLSEQGTALASLSHGAPGCSSSPRGWANPVRRRRTNKASGPLSDCWKRPVTGLDVRRRCRVCRASPTTHRLGLIRMGLQGHRAH